MSGVAVRSDQGFGLIEVVTALFLLALISVVSLPVLANSLQESSGNIARSTASQLVAKELNLVRAVDANCTSVRDHGADPLGLLWTDPRGTVLQIHRTAQSSCPSMYPALMDYRVYVTERGKSQVLAEASTRLFVSSASGSTAP
jgi:prepilin-type N-terminal cleavage/methylation domain-containing protein